MGNFHFNAYREDLKLLTDKAHSEYVHWGTTIHNQQLLFIRTYIWISSILFAAEFSFFIKMVTSKLPITINQSTYSPHFNWVFGVLYVLALLCSGFCFLVGTDALRGREDFKVPYSDFSTHADHARNDALNNTVTFYDTLLRNLNKSVEQHQDQRHYTANKLRRMAWLLISSFILFVLACCVLFIEST